jgi:ABC-type dipeptide/oligopeptide/nickel transport system permease subunit
MAKEVALELDSPLTPPSAAPRWLKILRLARAHPLGVFGLCCILLISFCALFADLIVPYDPEAIAGLGDADTESPSLDHPFGTDRLGSDVFSRTIFGARIAMLIGVVSVTFGMVLGSAVGIASGYFGGFVDSVLQRIVDALLAFPAIVMLLAIIAVIGNEDSAVRGFLNSTPLPGGKWWGIPNFLDVIVISLAIGFAIAVGAARVIRGAVLSLKENVYIEAARAMGASDLRIMMRHVLPNVAALIVVLGTIFLPIAILAEAAISFLGVGPTLSATSATRDCGAVAGRAAPAAPASSQPPLRFALRYSVAQRLAHDVHVLVAATGEVDEDDLVRVQRLRQVRGVKDGVRGLQRRDDAFRLAEEREAFQGFAIGYRDVFGAARVLVEGVLGANAGIIQAGGD